MKHAHTASVGMFANILIDRRLEPPFGFEDIYEALEENRFFSLLHPFDEQGHLAWSRDAEQRQEIERLFQQAAQDLEGQEMAQVGVGGNSLCLIVALSFQVLQNLREPRQQMSPQVGEPPKTVEKKAPQPSLLSFLGIAPKPRTLARHTAA